MINIITSDGVVLDLDPEDVFSIELENPMFEDSLVPTAYSTQIQFLLTPTNLKAFGYLDFMFFEPRNKKIGATVSVDGIPLFTGTLVYDSFEDGKIIYTFSGQDIEDEWSEKIWKRNIIGIIQSDPASVFSEIYNGNYLAVYAPPMVNLSETGAADSDINQLSTKFHNEKSDSTNHGEEPFVPEEWKSGSVFTPVFRISFILAKEMSRIDMDEDIAEYMKYLCIVGLYKPHTDTSVNGWPSVNVDIGTSLPDVTAGELFKNILKMFCAVIFVDGSRYKVMTSEKVFSGSAIEDWTEKLSDSWSFESEGAQEYKFSYANDDSENTLPSESVSGVPEYSTLYEAVNALSEDNPNTRHEMLQDVYSWSSRGADMVYHNRKNYQAGVSDEDGTFDNSCDFSLVRCVPYRFWAGYYVLWSSAVGAAESGIFFYERTSMAAIVEPGTLGERGTRMYIGLVADRRQLSDKGVIFNDTGYHDTKEAIISSDYDFGVSIAPQDLSSKFHAGFAQWVTSSRQTVTGSLNLSLLDIANFRMWHKVLLRGRVFFVKKLTFSLNVKTGRIETEGQFVSA